MMKNLRDILRYVSPEENEGESINQNSENEDPTRKTRRWPISRRFMEAALQDICEYNDISEEQLVSAPETITSIEMFLYNFPHICCMSFFPNLVSLSLVQQNLLSIEGLHYCPHLELLRLSENSIQRIEGLGNCLKLKELFLHCNRINRITGIAHLTNLDVLWLSNNEIRTVDGLGDLRLKELSLARNPITQLGEVLNMKELEFLNVAATNIGSFKEIGNLTRLKNLKDLRFSDPQWGDSPLTLLHNYQSVDTVDLTEEAKQAARAMYTRKRVYYNMCIKSLQQNRNNSTNPCLKADIQRIKCLQKNLSKLIKTRKDMEKEMCEEPDIETARTGSGKSDPRKSKEWWVQIMAKISMVDQQISNLIKHLDNLRTQLQLGKAKDQAAVDLNIHWLMVELDTGGNIRMEVGNSKDAWFKSCMDLVMSRFFPVDFVPFSITGMQVLKVTRIHNRFLQDRFERTLEGYILKGNKRHVEYLLYGETLQAPDELQWIIEEGFPFSTNDHNPNMSTGAVVLSNSIGLADMYRLQEPACTDKRMGILPNATNERVACTLDGLAVAAKGIPRAIAEQTSNGSCRGKTTGWLLVVKTCLGASVRDITHAYTRNPRAAIVINGVLQTEGENFAPAKKTSYPHADSVYRTHPMDPTQRSWSVFDSATVVPEYLVEYEYSFKESDTSKLDPATAKNAKLSKETALTNGLTEDVHLSESEGKGKCQPTRAENDYPNAYDLVCSSSPHSGKGVALSVEYLQRRNGLEGSFLHLSYLNLHNCNITGVDLLRGLPSLKVLVLSFNKISQITGLQDLCVLERLDMSYNLLKRIEGLSGLSNLLTLDLAGNEIWCSDDLGLLQLQVPGLLNLNLRSNPIVDESSYHSLVLRSLPSLAELDCKAVTTEDRVAAMSKYCPQPIVFPTTAGKCEIQPATSGVSLSFNEQDLENAINFHRPKAVPEGADGKVGTKSAERVEKVTRTATPKIIGPKQLADPFRLSPYRLNQFTKFHRIETSSKRKSVHLTKEGPVCYEGVEEVHLEHRKLKTMYCFDRLPNLRRLFLSGNEISVIAGLDNCTMLEELILDDNVIKQVSGISKLQSLWRLDLGCNKLTTCIDVGAFTTIEQLSIDNNQISSLKGIEGLVSLMELYAQNNQLTKMMEINHIRDLPKLMVVNFCGNVFCEARDYRLYTVYSLRKLKVLDSINVNSTELADARNKYTGRLQKEVVEECVGHKHLEALQVLDLSEQKIRHCGDVFESPEFQNLRELNLNNNMISSLHPLRYLSNLLILRLENNSIENGPLLRTPSLSPSPEAAQSESKGERLGKTVNSVASTSRHALQSLEVLELSGNNIISIMSLRLSSFPMLKHLSLQDNKITKVDGMENLKHLEHLYLNHNSIKELDPGSFASMQNLRVLHLGDNSLKTLVHIGGLISLESLDLTSNLLTPNRLGGFASIDYLSPLPKLTKLWLNNNPMSRQNQYRNSVISRLEHLEQLDGRPISQEDRQDADAYASGKEPNTLVLDPSILLESAPNSMSVGGQIKVPLKVTSLNFDTMCAPQPTILNGLRGYGINQASTQNTSHNSHLNTQYNSQKQWEQFDSKQAGSLVRKDSSQMYSDNFLGLQHAHLEDSTQIRNNLETGKISLLSMQPRYIRALFEVRVYRLWAKACLHDLYSRSLGLQIGR